MDFISPAFAQAAASPAAGSDLFSSLIPFILILPIMYFLVLRPQQQKTKDHALLIKNVRRGDTITSSGGLIGKVTRATEDGEVEMEIAPNVRVRLARQMIADVRSKGEPVKE